MPNKKGKKKRPVKPKKKKKMVNNVQFVSVSP